MANAKIKTATLGGTVWNDVNKDGRQNDGNMGIAHVKVLLLNGDGKATGKFVYTDDAGNYSFAGLKPGEYSVKFDATTLPNGSTFTQKDVGNNNFDSDANITTGKTGTVELKAGEVNTLLDAGVVLPVQNNTATVNGHVWDDSNNTNGIQDAGEGVPPGLISVVDLYSVDANGVPDGTVMLQSFVDTNGNYSFTNLPAGQYIERFGSPEGYGLTRFNQGGNDATDNDFNPLTSSTDVFTLTAGQINNDVDMGFSNALSTISTRVWGDENANGIQNAGELGLAGAQVFVYSGQGIPGTVIASGVTDSNGDFNAHVTPGEYSLRVSGVEGYFRPTLQNVGLENADSDITGQANGQTTDWFLVQPNETVDTIDAGFIKDPLVDIGAKQGVWLDKNGNGAKDDGSSAGVGGVTVTLTSGGVDVATTTTNSDGDYLFSQVNGLKDYRITFSNIPTDKQFTTANVGEILVFRVGFIDIATDSDVIDSAGHTQQSPYDGMISAGLVDIIGTPATVI
jgi:SdrD B-like domain